MKNNLQVRFVTWFMVFAILLVLSGCSKSELSRRKAGGLIEESEKFSPAPCSSANVTMEQARNGVQAGMWTMTDWGGGDFALFITPKGKPFFATAGFTAGWRPPIKLVKPFPRHVEEVTGITDSPSELGSAGATKVVLFTWKWDWKALPPEILECKCVETNPQVLKGQALLKLYDDGWRVEELQAD